LFSLFGWNRDNKYRITGSLYEQDGEVVYVFDAANSEAFFKPYILPQNNGEGAGGTVHPFMPSGKHIRAVPESWTSRFGKDYYWEEHTLTELAEQSETEWKLRLEGQLFETGKKLNVTGFEELRLYITKELSTIQTQEES
jgi:hypothetical protein